MKHCHIVIKFKKEAILSRTDEVLTLKNFATQDNFLNQFSYKSVVTNEMLFPKKNINKMNFENLVGICCVQGIDNISLEEKKNLARKMDTYDFIEYAYVEIPFPSLPVPGVLKNKNKIYSIDDIPDFTSLQGYKDGITTDHTGIDMEYAWANGIHGEGISCGAIETQYNAQHVNLKRASFVETNNHYSSAQNDHGTAVAGILYANDIGSGIRGLVYGADTFYATSDLNKDFTTTMTGLLAQLKSGDVLSISRGYYETFAPIDYEPAIWDIAKEGLSADICICIGAGNGNTDLDTDERLAEYRQRVDIGLIHVGAGNKKLIKEDFSNYGKTLVQLQGWGSEVVSTGYGDLYDGSDIENYTRVFDGTSSATPIVASAVVAVQSWHKHNTGGKILTPFEIRNLLIETGTPQADPENGHIGPIPNVRNAIEELEKRLQLKTKS